MSDELFSRLVDFSHPDFASIFDEQSHWSAQFGRLLFDHLALRPNLHILDVGCATGFPLFELATRHGASCQVVGLDVWRAALDRAAWKKAYYGCRNAHLVQIDGQHYPLPDAAFDLIVSNLGINNFDDPRRTLAECARVAKPGARLVLTTNLSGHMAEFYEVYRAVLANFGRADYLQRLAHNEAHRGTEFSHASLLNQAGFKVTRVIKDSFTLRYLDGSAFLRHPLTVFGFLEAWRKVVDPADEQAVFSALETRLNQQGALRMTVPMLYLEARRA